MIVTIDSTAERRLWALIRSTKDEIGGMGYAFMEGGSAIHWLETFLVPQEVSSSEVDFESTNGDQHAIERALKDGVLENPDFVWVSWHSHHVMSAFWSGTDDARIAAMRKVGVKRLLSFVGCHDGTFELRLDLFDGLVHGVTLPQITLKPTLQREARELDEFEKQIAAEVEANVKVKKVETFAGFGWYDTDTLKLGTPKLKGKPPLTPNGKLITSRTPTRAEEERYEKRLVTELQEHKALTSSEAWAMLDTMGADACEDLLSGVPVR